MSYGSYNHEYYIAINRPLPKLKLGTAIKVHDNSIAGKLNGGVYYIDSTNAVLHSDSTKPYVLINKGKYIIYLHDIEVWKPKPYGTYMFWNTGSNLPVLGVFSHMDGDIFITEDDDRFDRCYPYTGDVFW